MSPLVAAFALLAVLVVLLVPWGRQHRRDAPPAAEDRRSNAVLGLAHTVVLLAAVLFPALGVGRLPLGDGFAWAAVGVMAAALALQLWAMRTLGARFTPTLQADTTQPLVERGPYRRVRHPGYLAQIVFFLALGCATRNGWSLALIVPAVAAGYAHRIRSEERLLERTLGDAWRDYARRRARLIPGIF